MEGLTNHQRAQRRLREATSSYLERELRDSGLWAVCGIEECPNPAIVKPAATVLRVDTMHRGNERGYYGQARVQLSPECVACGRGLHRIDGAEVADMREAEVATRAR